MELPIIPPPIITISQTFGTICGRPIHSANISSTSFATRDSFIDAKPFLSVFDTIVLESFLVGTILSGVS